MNIEEFNKIKEKYIHSVPVNVVELAEALGISVYGIELDNCGNEKNIRSLQNVYVSFRR